MGYNTAGGSGVAARSVGAARQRVLRRGVGEGWNRSATGGGLCVGWWGGGRQVPLGRAVAARRDVTNRGGEEERKQSAERKRELGVLEAPPWAGPLVNARMLCLLIIVRKSAGDRVPWQTKLTM